MHLTTKYALFTKFQKHVILKIPVFPHCYSYDIWLIHNSAAIGNAKSDPSQFCAWLLMQDEESRSKAVTFSNSFSQKQSPLASLS